MAVFPQGSSKDGKPVAVIGRHGSSVPQGASRQGPTLAAPVVDSFVADSDSELTLTWLTVSGATGYEVRIKKTSDGAFGSWVDVGLVLTHQFTGLDAGTEYQAQVRAYDAVPNYSNPSTTATQSTDALSSLLTSLMAYWKLDEASAARADSAGANTLTDNNTVTSTTGKIGNAAQFVAANTEFLSIADNTDLSTGDIDFTFACWVKLETVAASGLVGKWNIASQREYSLQYAGSRFTFFVSPNGTLNTSVAANALGVPTAGIWYLIVCWHDASANTINIQVNNGTVNSAAHATGVFDSTAAFELGRGGAAPLDGLLDEVGFWKRVLTTDERTALYNGGSGITHPFS